MKPLVVKKLQEWINDSFYVWGLNFRTLDLLISDKCIDWFKDWKDIFQETDLDMNSFLSLIQNSDVRNKLLDKVSVLLAATIKAADDFIQVCYTFLKLFWKLLICIFKCRMKWSLALSTLFSSRLEYLQYKTVVL